MTGVRELAETWIPSAAPEQIRLSVLGDSSQMDVSLPLDAPIAILVPELVKLIRSREDSPSETPDDISAKEARHHLWVLSRADGGPPLDPDETLRTAEVVDGDLLRLTAQRALTAPTLSDDVVDAAARLNKAAHAGWDAAAARWMAFVGLFLGAAIWVYFLVDNAFRTQRGATIGLATVVAAAMVGVAALFNRSYGDRDIGAALGWAAIPITAAVAWALLSPLGQYVEAAGCAGMLFVLYVFYRVIGTGHWAYIVGAVYFGLGGLAMLAHALAVPAAATGTVLANVGTLACLTVPRLTARLGRFDIPLVDVESASEGADFNGPPVRDPQRETGVSVPSADDVWARIRSAAVTRSALYCGLALTAATAASVVVRDQGQASWAGLTFAAACAAALGLYVRHPRTAVERASLGIPAASLVVIAGVLAQDGANPKPLVGFGVLLALAIAGAAIGFNASNAPDALTAAGRPRRLTTALSYLEYLVSAALIPLGLWVTGGYAQLGLS